MGETAGDLAPSGGSQVAASGAAAIYKQHIKSLPAEERLELLALIARELARERAASANEARHSLMELRGLGKEIWEGIHAQEYVDKLRGAWDDQPS